MNCESKFRIHCLTSELYPIPNDSNNLCPNTEKFSHWEPISISAPAGPYQRHILRQLQKLLQDFWQRWSRNYLCNHQGREKWKTDEWKKLINTFVLTIFLHNAGTKVASSVYIPDETDELVLLALKHNVDPRLDQFSRSRARNAKIKWRACPENKNDKCRHSQREILIYKSNL